MLEDIFLIRHGQPLSNTGLNYRTLPGPGLTERGKEEARQAAAFIADKGVQHLFASPFDRTAQTAEQIVATLDIDLPITFTRLIQEHAPGESNEHVQARIREFLAGIEDSPLQRIALVSHGSPIRTMLLELSPQPIKLNLYIYPGNNPAPTAGIWHARRSERGWHCDLAFKPT